MGWIAAAAGVAFGVALVMLMLFFRTKDARYDRVAEWSFVLFAVLAVPTIATVAGRLSGDGIVVPLVTAAGIIGVVLMGLGELGSTLKIVDFRRIAGVVTIGFLAFLLWIGAASILIVTGSGLAAGLGWLGLAAIVLGIAVVAWVSMTPGVISGQREPGNRQMSAFIVPMVGIVAWLLWLGLSLG